ncbi:MAG: glycosyltransferase, partial [Muribaculaceae bacterium]|nr:glycosyltransferase [Muribaculaceae bacterium]
MKVTLINHSDSQGGAAIVSLRLVHALRRKGVDARMLVIDKRDIDVVAQPLGGVIRNKWNFLVERLGIFMRNGMKRDTLFKIDTCSRGVDPLKHPWVQEADVVMLAWVNQGTLSLKGIKKLADSKPVVWVMHDMWNCTGVCHYAMSCERYLATCSACPLLKGKGNDLSTKIQLKKSQLYNSTDIRFVAVSHWLEQCCRKSSLMKDCDVRVIYNAFPAHDYEFERWANSDYDIDENKKVVVMGARRLDVEVKGLRELIDATKYIAANEPQLAEQLHLLLFGDIAKPELLNELALPFTHIGPIDNTAELNNIYRHADVVLSTAQYENLPTTLIEGMASGCVAVTYGNGGQADIVDHLKNGYIAPFAQADQLAKGLQWAITADVSREQQHMAVVQKFSA